MKSKQWLESVHEETLDPQRPICDPHHHLWDYPESRYLLGDILEDTGSGHNVSSTVFVECGSMYRQDDPVMLKPIGETEFVQGIAAMSASGNYGSTRVAKGIVSYADLTLGDQVEEVLWGHINASQNRFKGIRHASGWHADKRIRNSHSAPPEHLLLDPQFRRGFSVLESLGLTFDAWFYHHQFDDFIDLARSYPEVTIILDHFGGPLGIGPYRGKQQEVFSSWKQKIVQLKGCENVFFKLGGINMKINGFEWHQNSEPPGSDALVEATGHYYHYCIEQFGSRRCMFESNFPVDKESCSYNVLWNAFKKMTADYSDSEKSALFHDTAVAVYGLNDNEEQL
jgi:predicted TIM-barrel fold metal-dependent hydrolase